MLVENELKSQRALYEGLEPENNGSTKGKESTFALSSPNWLRAVRELRTVILDGYKSYEMEAAVKVLRRESPFEFMD